MADLQANAELKEIPVESIRENPNAVRQVNKQDPKYPGLVDSVKQYGVVNPIVVRRLPSDNGEELYGLVDGLHRYSATLDSGRKTISAKVMNMSDALAMHVQLIGNIQKIETKPVEYSKQLYRILTLDPTLTLLGLAGQLNTSQQWVQDRLGLLKIIPALQTLVDEGKINLTNAYFLAKLPEEEQKNFADRAQTMSPAEFMPTVLARKREIDKANRQGRAAMPDVFTPMPHLQKLGELTAELNTPTLAGSLCNVAKAKTPEQGFAAAIAWVLHMDPTSIQIATEKDRVRRKADDDKKAAAKTERLKRQLAEATA